MATKSELVQSINSAFSGEQQRVMHALLELATGALPVATASTPGVISVGAGLAVNGSGVLSVAG